MSCSHRIDPVYLAEEALFGEVGGSHGVLSSSLDSAVARRLAPRLDLPGQLPPGTAFGNFVTGFPFDDYVVFARVSLDGAATRPGMVFAHAMLLHQSNVAQLTSVEPLFAMLLSERPKTLIARQTKVACSGEPSSTPEYLPAVARLLVSGGQQPAVIADVEAIEHVVIGLWPHLPGALRIGLAYGVAFAPEDIVEVRLDLVGTPVATASRWKDVLFPGVANGGGSNSPAAGLLIGKAPTDFEQFTDELAVEISSFTTLARIDQAWMWWTALPSTFSWTLAAAKHVSKLQPSADRGRGLKASVIARLARTLSTVDDLLQLRTFETAAFEHADRLWQAAERCMRDSLTGAVATADGVRLTVAALQSSVLPDWRCAFDRSLRELPKEKFEGFATVVWAVIATQPALVPKIALQCPPPQVFDVVLADALAEARICPSSDAVSAVLLVAQWPAAEAELILRHAADRPSAALDQICSRVVDPADAGIDRLLSRMQDSEILCAALTLRNRRIQECAVDCIVRDPELLAAADVGNPKIQDLWIGALSKSGQSWRIGGGAEARWQNALCAALQDPGAVRPQLFEQLAMTPLANQLGHPQRAEIWRVIPAAVVELYLAATARAWIASINGGVVAPAGVVEDRLGRMIAGQTCRAALQEELSKAAVSTGLAVFSVVPQLTEAVYETWLIGVVGQSALQVSEAEEAGSLLINRGWQQSVRRIFDRYADRQDLRPLFKVCAGVLTVFERLMYGLSQQTPSELYALLTEEAIHLLPNGPCSRGVWEAAGGSEADLVGGISGGEQWKAAIARLRYGARPGARALVGALLDEFPNNEKLKYLNRQGL